MFADASSPTKQSKRIVIGIIAQETIDVFDLAEGHSFIAASYVKYVECGGGYALLIRTGGDEEHYRKIFDNINGLLIPGGGVSVEHSEYSRISRLFFDWAKEANEGGDVFPIIGICLGFEQLLYMVASKNPLTTCAGGMDYNACLIPTKDWDKCRMLSSMSDHMKLNVMQKQLCYNNHEYCIEMSTFETDEKLTAFFNIGALSKCQNERHYIAFAEGKEYPFFALQWHPEKPLFEYQNNNITRDRMAVSCAQYYIDYFMGKAALNSHVLNENCLSMLSFFYEPELTLEISPFVQCYIFNDNEDVHNKSRPKQQAALKRKQYRPM